MKDHRVVLRAGVVDEANIRNGAKVDTIDKVINLSVQVTKGTAKQDQNTIQQLLKAVPNNHYALTFAQNILDKGGTITLNALDDNPLHALINNITVHDLVEIFKINKH